MYIVFLKRLFDLFVAFFLIIIISPIFVISTTILFIFNPKSSPIFYQVRIGKNAKKFRIYKFKTMTDECDSHGKLLPDEKRMTPIGKFLRSTSLDELPQLFNVLIGDMSLIGPRPLIEKYIPLYSKKQFRRHEVRPGITGWAQVNGRNNIRWEEKFEFDVWYVDNLSFLLDIRIIFLTVVKVLQRKDITTIDPKTFEPFNGKN